MSEKGQALLGQLSAARAEYNKPRRSNVRTMHDLVPLQPAPERRRTKKRKLDPVIVFQAVQAVKKTGGVNKLDIQGSARACSNFMVMDLDLDAKLATAHASLSEAHHNPQTLVRRLHLTLSSTFVPAAGDTPASVTLSISGGLPDAPPGSPPVKLSDLVHDIEVHMKAIVPAKPAAGEEEEIKSAAPVVIHPPPALPATLPESAPAESALGNINSYLSPPLDPSHMASQGWQGMVRWQSPSAQPEEGVDAPPPPATGSPGGGGAGETKEIKEEGSAKGNGGGGGLSWAGGSTSPPPPQSTAADDGAGDDRMDEGGGLAGDAAEGERGGGGDNNGNAEGGGADDGNGGGGEDGGAGGGKKEEEEARYDGFKITREVKVPEGHPPLAGIKFVIAIRVQGTEQYFKVPPVLSTFINIKHGTKPQIITCIWRYLKNKNLQAHEAEKRHILTLDPILKNALQLHNEQIFAHQLLERLNQVLSSGNCQMPQTGLQHSLKIDMVNEPAASQTQYGKAERFGLDVVLPPQLSCYEPDEDLERAAHISQKEIDRIDAQIAAKVEELNTHRIKRDFYDEYATQPMEFTNFLLTQQVADAEIALNPTADAKDNAVYYAQPWGDEAALAYLNKVAPDAALGL